MPLDQDPVPPYRVLESAELIREWDLAVRRERVLWPDGSESTFRVVDGPGAAFVVPYSAAGTTVLVRQWRHAWRSTAWEVPAGTLEPGEAPLAAAQRELEEEAGLLAAQWTPLGVTRGSGIMSGLQHLYLARGLSRVRRAPEPSEQDMVLRELPFREALDAALGEEIEHAASVAALVRAARVLGLI